MRALKITDSITRRDEKSLEKYLAEISRYDVLTPEEELSLFKEYKSGNETALLKIILHNLRFVVSVAKQYQFLGLWLGDLINEGNMGLIKAAHRFDETRGFKFISYGVWWIRQSILQAVNEKSRNIRLPLNLAGNTAKVMNTFIKILQDEEREPSIEELAEATQLSEETVKKCLRHYTKCRSLDAPVRDDSETSLANMIADSNASEPDYEVAVRESQKTEVRQLLKLLPKRQATVLSLYYGIGQKYPMNLSDIAEYIGTNRERARQIRDKGLRNLRVRARKFSPTFSPN